MCFHDAVSGLNHVYKSCSGRTIATIAIFASDTNIARKGSNGALFRSYLCAYPTSDCRYLEKKSPSATLTTVKMEHTRQWIKTISNVYNLLGCHYNLMLRYMAIRDVWRLIWTRLISTMNVGIKIENTDKLLFVRCVVLVRLFSQSVIIFLCIIPCMLHIGARKKQSTDLTVLAKRFESAVKFSRDIWIRPDKLICIISGVKRFLQDNIRPGLVAFRSTYRLCVLTSMHTSSMF